MEETMSAQTIVSDDDPRMEAWLAYKETAEFANSRRWAITSKQTVEYPNLDGSLWAVFIEGFQAGRGVSDARLGEIMNAADALWNESDNERLKENIALIFNLAAEALGYTRRLA